MIDRGGRWFRRYGTRTEPDLRLVCFPHAGGTPTAFRGWPTHLPKEIEVLATCYPGRQDRVGEPFSSTIEALADEITAELAGYLDKPLALFGHSMGAVVAHEVSLRLHTLYDVRPVRLFVSGCEAPHRRELTDLYTVDDSEFLAEIKRLGNSSLDAITDPDLLALVLPSIRADYQLIETYRPSSAAKTRSPLVAYVGDSDPDCEVDAVRAWSETTAADFELRVFPGDHFYLEPHERELLAHISGHLGHDLRLRHALSALAGSRQNREMA